MSRTATFVRTEMLPPKPAPVTEQGAIKWMRENLFSGPLNTGLTLFGLFAVWWIASAAFPWLRNSVWTANNLAECRQIIQETWGEGATGACWAVIRERWTQFIYGFYPNHLYWRPNLAFVLLFVALAPVLFTQLPRKMLWFTGIYPGLAYWLLWGGTLWFPVSWYLGFAAGFVAYVVLSRHSTFAASVAAVVAAIAWWIWLAGPFMSMVFDPTVAGAVVGSVGDSVAEAAGLPTFALETVRSDRFGGFILSVIIGVSAISLSLPLGIILALGRQSDLFLVKSLSVVFIEFIRGVPLITLLFTASLLLNYFLPPGSNFDIILRVVIMVTLFASAYIAEVIRGGLAALPKGQYEAADALGLDYWQAQRLIILPQALKISIPGIVSSFIGLFKDTTLVVFVGLLDPLKGITDAVRADIAWKGIYWEPYIFVGTLFFLCCFGMSRYSMYLEQKLKTDHR